MNRRVFLASASACGLASLAVRPARAAAWLDDLDVLRRALALHPGLYRYSTPAQIAGRLAALETRWTAAPDLDARYLTLSRFLATIRCGHTYANFFNQRANVATALFDRPTRLPFYFVWRGTRMIVAGDPSKLGVPVGAEVTRVNGQAPGDILAALMPLARADGHNDDKRRALLSVTGTDDIEYFDVFHGLVFGAPPNGRHDVVLQRVDGGESRLRLPALDLAGRRAQMRRLEAIERDAEAPFWDFAWRDEDIAILTMPSWETYKTRWDWRAWLSARLDEVARRPAKGLIVDLRGNEGGEDCGDLILARLASTTLSQPGAERRVRFQRTPADLDAYLDTWDNSFRTLGVGARPIGSGFFRLNGERGDGDIPPMTPHLALKAAILIGPENSSATFQFADKARRGRVARLFGETTGGNQRGINGGCFFFVRLPESGLEFDLPLIGEFPPGRPPDAGLPPDVTVQAGPADLAAGRDPALEAALRWVQSG